MEFHHWSAPLWNDRRRLHFIVAEECKGASEKRLENDDSIWKRPGVKYHGPVRLTAQRWSRPNEQPTNEPCMLHGWIADA